MSPRSGSAPGAGSGWRVVTTRFCHATLAPDGKPLRAARSKDPRARERLLREPARDGGRRARPLARTGELRARVRSGDRRRLRTVAPARRAARRARRALRHRASAGQPPGPDRRRLGRGAGRERHEGGRRRAARAGARPGRRARRDGRRSRAARLRARGAARERKPAAGSLRGYAAPARGRARDPARAHRWDDRGRLRRQPQRPARLPRHERPLRPSVAGRERDLEGRRRAARDRGPRAPRGGGLEGSRSTRC